jgi:Nucleotidyltransferase/DNA polymerase involved in DNA repair
MPGVGKVFAGALRSRGIATIGDIARLPAEYFASVFGKGGLDLWERANGKGSETLVQNWERKGISCERTFNRDISSLPEIESYLFNLVGKICQQLRDENKMAGNIHIKLRYSDFSTITRACRVPPTVDDRFVYETALNLLRKGYTRRVGVRLIGIGMSSLVEFHSQDSLFETKEEKREKMMFAVNKIRDKFGFSAIELGVRTPP